MGSISDREREALWGRLGEAAACVQDVQGNLVANGHLAFRPLQKMLFEFAESDEERVQLLLYLKEIAKEALGANRRPGTGVIGSDGFRSEYLEKLRRRRDSDVGGLEEYKRATSGLWRFEINSAVRRFSQFRAEYPDEFNERIAQANDTAWHCIAQEAVDCHLSDFGADFADSDEMVKCLRLAYSQYLHYDGLVIGKGKLSEFKPVTAFPINERWTAAIYINMPAWFLQPSPNLAVIDQHTILVKKTPEETVRTRLKEQNDYHRLRVESTIYGFGAYRSARTFAELALAVKVQARLLSEFMDGIKAAVESA